MIKVCAFDVQVPTTQTNEQTRDAETRVNVLKLTKSMHAPLSLLQRKPDSRP